MLINVGLLFPRTSKGQTVTNMGLLLPRWLYIQFFLAYCNVLVLDFKFQHEIQQNSFSHIDYLRWHIINHTFLLLDLLMFFEGMLCLVSIPSEYFACFFWKCRVYTGIWHTVLHSDNRPLLYLVSNCYIFCCNIYQPH